MNEEETDFREGDSLSNLIFLRSANLVFLSMVRCRSFFGSLMAEIFVLMSAKKDFSHSSNYPKERTGK